MIWNYHLPSLPSRWGCSSYKWVSTSASGRGRRRPGYSSSRPSLSHPAFVCMRSWGHTPSQWTQARRSNLKRLNIPNILIIKVYQIFKLRAQGLLSFSKKLMRKGLYLFAQCTYCTSDFKYSGTGTHVSFTKNIISVPSFNQNISLIPFESKWGIDILQLTKS